MRELYLTVGIRESVGCGIVLSRAISRRRLNGLKAYARCPLGQKRIIDKEIFIGLNGLRTQVYFAQKRIAASGVPRPQLMVPFQRVSTTNRKEPMEMVLIWKLVVALSAAVIFIHTITHL